MTVAALLALPPSAPAKDDLRFAPGPPRDPAFLELVNGAIDRGVAWMRSRQGTDGTFGDGPSRTSAYPFGYTALGVHVLRSCGAPADDPAVVKGIEALRRLYRSGSAFQHAETYQLALGLLALEAHFAAPPDEKEAGGSRYGKPAKPAARRIPAADLEWMRSMAHRICSAQDPCGAFGYQGTDGYGGTGRRGRGGWDHSNTQYALLGLKAARRCGVDIDTKVFLRCLEHLLDDQEPSGPAVERRETDDAGGDRYGPRSRAAGTDHARGWGYRGRSTATGSMTSGGVSSVVICRGELQGRTGYGGALDGRAVKSIRDGIAWIGRNFSVTGNPSAAGRGGSGWHYYWLYGLERAGVLAGVTWTGPHDWYLEGARYLLGAQESGGGWEGGGGFSAAAPGAGPGRGNLLDTAFALLFLKKATFRVEGAVATEESDSSLDLSGAADLDDASFRAVFDTVRSRFARAAEKDRAARAADFVRLGVRALGLLVLDLEAEGAAEREVAIDALRRVTGQTLGYDPAAPQEVRSAAVAAWEEWYVTRRRGLVGDAAAGRFREGAGPR